MKQGICKGAIFRAPQGGDIICTHTNINNAIYHLPNDEILDPGDRCKIICDAAFAIPEYVTCEYNGWNHPSEGKNLNTPND